MKYFKLALVLLVVYLLQISIMPLLGIANAFPNLVLIFAIIYLLDSKFDEAFIFSAFGGILLDISSCMRFGIFSLDLIFIYLIFYFFVKKYISEPIFIIIFAVFLLSSAIFELPGYLFVGKNTLIYLYTIIYDAFLGIILYYLKNLIFTKKSKTYYILDK